MGMKQHCEQGSKLYTTQLQGAPFMCVAAFGEWTWARGYPWYLQSQREYFLPSFINFHSFIEHLLSTCYMPGAGQGADARAEMVKVPVLMELTRPEE